MLLTGHHSHWALLAGPYSMRLAAVPDRRNSSRFAGTIERLSELLKLSGRHRIYLSEIFRFSSDECKNGNATPSVSDSFIDRPIKVSNYSLLPDLIPPILVDLVRGLNVFWRLRWDRSPTRFWLSSAAPNLISDLNYASVLLGGLRPQTLAHRKSWRRRSM